MIGPHQIVGNKYSRWYFSIIEKAKRRNLTGYSERHHVYPRCFGGTKKPTVRLTAREHFLCHWLLTKCTTGQSQTKMENAFTMMLMDRHGKRLVSGWRYEVARKYCSKSSSKRMSGANHPFYGKKRPEHAKKIGDRLRGVPKSEAHKSKIKATWPESRSPVTCQHCGKVTSMSMHKRWHGERCKLSPTYDPMVHSEFIKKMKAPKSEETKKKIRESVLRSLNTF